jgi:hypothetical protein
MYLIFTAVTYDCCKINNIIYCMHVLIQCSNFLNSLLNFILLTASLHLSKHQLESLLTNVAVFYLPLYPIKLAKVHCIKVCMQRTLPLIFTAVARKARAYTTACMFFTVFCRLQITMRTYYATVVY